LKRTNLRKKSSKTQNTVSYSETPSRHHGYSKTSPRTETNQNYPQTVNDHKNSNRLPLQAPSESKPNSTQLNPALKSTNYEPADIPDKNGLHQHQKTKAFRQKLRSVFS
jgi:hypothetical protein